jgi:hypothetical protein
LIPGNGTEYTDPGNTKRSASTGFIPRNPSSTSFFVFAFIIQLPLSGQQARLAMPSSGQMHITSTRSFYCMLAYALKQVLQRHQFNSKD